jgi:hypothetical protein
MAKFKHITSGQPLKLSAGDYNALVDMARNYYSKQLSLTSDASPLFSSNVEVTVLNDTSSDFDIFNVVGIKDILITPTTALDEFKYNYAFKVEVPNNGQSTSYLFKHTSGKFGITQEPIPQGKLGRVVIGGITVCKVNINANEDWFFRADIKTADATQLQSYGGGSAQILWKETGTGSKWAVVSLGNNPAVEFTGKLDGTLSANSSATMSVYYDSGSSLVDSTFNCTVYAPPMLTSGSIASGKWVGAIWKPQRFKLVVNEREC